jgi:hypothetical protein
MQKLTLKSFSEKRKINKIESLEFISGDLDIIPKEVKAFLCGFEYLEIRDNEGKLVDTEIKPCRDARNHKEDYLPNLEGLIILLDSVEIDNQKSQSLLKVYKNSKNINWKFFFRLWSEVIKETSLCELYSMEKWFVIVLEDKLTLGASFNGKCPCDLLPYKKIFNEEIKQ